VHLTSGIIVGIEQISVLRVDRRVVRQSFFQKEGLKKPAGVRKMPFRRTNLGYSLDYAILRLKRFAKAFAQLSNATIGSAQVIRPFAWLIVRNRIKCCFALLNHFISSLLERSISLLCGFVPFNETTVMHDAGSIVLDFGPRGYAVWPESR
jgi:hypothetical protein